MPITSIGWILSYVTKLDPLLNDEVVWYRDEIQPALWNTQTGALVNIISKPQVATHFKQRSYDRYTTPALDHSKHNLVYHVTFQLHTVSTKLVVNPRKEANQIIEACLHQCQLQLPFPPSVPTSLTNLVYFDVSSQQWVMWRFRCLNFKPIKLTSNTTLKILPSFSPLLRCISWMPGTVVRSCDAMCMISQEWVVG